MRHRPRFRLLVALCACFLLPFNFPRPSSLSSSSSPYHSPPPGGLVQQAARVGAPGGLVLRPAPGPILTTVRHAQRPDVRR